MTHNNLRIYGVTRHELNMKVKTNLTDFIKAADELAKDWQFITMDSDGSVCAYFYKPQCNYYQGYWQDSMYVALDEWLEFEEGVDEEWASELWRKLIIVNDYTLWRNPNE